METVVRMLAQTYVFIVLFIISVPIHELFHLISIRLLGDRRPIKVEWIKFLNKNKTGIELRGSVSIERGIALSNSLQPFGKKYPGTIKFIVGCSGGLGAAVFFGIISIFLCITDFRLDTINFWPTFALIAIIHGLLGLKEGMLHARHITKHKKATAI